MKSQLIFFFSEIVILFFSCSIKEQKKVEKDTFSIPVIIQRQTKDTITLLKKEFVCDATQPFVGKYKFSDTIVLQTYYDTTYRKDYLDYDGKIEMHDTFPHDGFQIIIDYKTTIPYCAFGLTRGYYYYPVFIVNETQTTKVLLGKDDHVFAIQLAKDSHDIWVPIEYTGFEGCGVGDWGLKIYPKEFAVFLMPKYEGTFKTKICVRISIGGNIYTTTEFDGIINEGQFRPDPNDPFQKAIKERNNTEISPYFLGVRSRWFGVK